MASCLACVMAISAHAFLNAQQSPHGGAKVGPSPDPTSTRPGIVDPTDPAAFVKSDLQMQRQNETVVAASIRNPDHLLAAGNDYRFVDFPEDQYFGEHGFITRPSPAVPKTRASDPPAIRRVDRRVDRRLPIGDRGRTWTGGAVPGSPLDESAASLASPMKPLSNADAAQGGRPRRPTRCSSRAGGTR